MKWYCLFEKTENKQKAGDGPFIKKIFPDARGAASGHCTYPSATTVSPWSPWSTLTVEEIALNRIVIGVDLKMISGKRGG